MKKCGKCKVEKELVEFGKDKSRKDGLNCNCKECRRQSGKVYREANPNAHKNWCKNNPDRVRVHRNKYKKANREKIAAQDKVYRKANLFKSRERCRRRRALKLQVKENYTKDNEELTLDLFNNQCFNCGSTEKLCIDHHKPLSKGNALTVTNAVVLCSSCNCSKHNANPEDFYSAIQLSNLRLLFKCALKLDSNIY